MKKHQTVNVTKKGFVKIALLKILQNLGEAAIEIIDEGFLNPRYSFTKPTRILLGLDQYPTEAKKIKPDHALNRKKIFSTTLYRLKKDGLVIKNGTTKNAKWKLTGKGEKYIANSSSGFIYSNATLPAVDDKIRIVSFDVPEKERWKRDRLRYILITSDYKLLHNSVWLGQRPLPDAVFQEIKYLKIRTYIHIFEISKKGTVRDVL